MCCVRTVRTWSAPVKIKTKVQHSAYLLQFFSWVVARRASRILLRCNASAAFVTLQFRPILTLRPAPLTI